MASGAHKEPKAIMFQSVPEGSPDIEKEDDYKPQLLNQEKSPLKIESADNGNGGKTARSD